MTWWIRLSRWTRHPLIDDVTRTLKRRDATTATIRDMPITVFDSRGLPSTSRERIEAAVVAGGRHSSAQYEAWISTDSDGTVRVIMIGPDGIERSFAFGPDEDLAVIAEMIRHSLPAW